MVRLVTAVVGGMEAGRVLILLLAIDGIHHSGRLEVLLNAFVLGGHILVDAKRTGCLRIGSQIVVVALLVAAVVGGVELFRLIHR
ncbi:hypothetical protein D3C81_2107150 [compost metagenome]